MQIVVLAVAYPTCCLRIVDIGRVMSRTWVVRWYNYSSSEIQIGAPHAGSLAGGGVMRPTNHPLHKRTIGEPSNRSIRTIQDQCNAATRVVEA